MDKEAGKAYHEYSFDVKSPDHYKPWLSAVMNDIATEIGLPPPHPDVSVVESDNGERYIYDYLLQQVKREEEPGWLQAVQKELQGDTGAFSWCPCAGCVERRLSCLCSSCAKFRGEAPSLREEAPSPKEASSTMDIDAATDTTQDGGAMPADGVVVAIPMSLSSPTVRSVKGSSSWRNRNNVVGQQPLTRNPNPE